MWVAPNQWARVKHLPNGLVEILLIMDLKARVGWRPR